MKLFKCIVMLILILITIRTGYLALLYKVSTSTGAFLICLRKNEIILNFCLTNLLFCRLYRRNNHD